MQLIGAGGHADELKQTYDRKLLDVLRKNLIFIQYGEKKPIPPRGGKSIEMRRFEKISFTEGSYVLTEGTPPAETYATISKVTATISQYGMYSKLTDLVTLQSYDPMLAEYSEKYGIAAAEALDIIVRDVVDAGTTVQYAGVSHQVGTSGTGAVGSGSYLNAAELTEAKRTLSRADVKPVVDGKFICVVHSDNIKDLMEDPDIWASFKDAAPRDSSNPLFTGNMYDWMGIRFIETTNLKVNSSYGMSGADVYEVVMFGKEAYAVTELSTQNLRMIIHPAGTGGHTDPLEQYSTVGWKAALAAAILDQNRIVVIKCASSRTPAA